MVEWDDMTLFTVAEAAKLCRCSEQTIRRACRDERLTWFKLRANGRIRIPAFSLTDIAGRPT
jgi:Helix-turn-helix domain